MSSSLDMLLAKHPPMRIQKIKDAAKDIPCVHCGSPHTVLAHMPQSGNHGRSLKCDDWWGAYLCNEENHMSPRGCHGYADGEGRNDWYWRAKMIQRSQRIMFELGLLTTT